MTPERRAPARLVARSDLKLAEPVLGAPGTWDACAFQQSGMATRRDGFMKLTP
jgi:hypothetical protein